MANKVDDRRAYILAQIDAITRLRANRESGGLSLCLVPLYHANMKVPPSLERRAPTPPTRRAIDVSKKIWEDVPVGESSPNSSKKVENVFCCCFPKK